MWKLSVMVWAGAATLAAQSPKYGVGQPPTAEQILNLGASIAPDGGGLPEGSGTVAAGRGGFAGPGAGRPRGEGGRGGAPPPGGGGRTPPAAETPQKVWGC